MKILIIPGSLRQNSSSYHIVRAIQALFPPVVNSMIYDQLGDLPHFNDADLPGEAVRSFKEKLRIADGVLIVTPEYAFGIPGSLKNAIDWTVGSSEFVKKPVAVITASSQGHHGHAALLLVLSAVSANIVTDSCFIISSVRGRLDEKGQIKDRSVEDELRWRIMKFVTELGSVKADDASKVA